MASAEVANDLFKQNQKMASESLFREKEVDNLTNLIYGSSGLEGDNELRTDTYRYDVNPERLKIFRSPAMKKALKQKFVTGQTQDQIVKNLLNMSDSDNDGELDRDQKDQLHKLEQNDVKTDKKAKRAKRLANMGIKEQDSGSEISDSD